MRRGVYPGSFNPPTTAHLALAAAAREQRNLDHVDLAVSTVALDKESVLVPSFDERLGVIRASLDDVEWLDVVVTPKQLIADIAEGYDLVLMGADKWAQLRELRYYDSPAHMHAALERLPELAVAPRDGIDIPAAAQLDVDPWVLEVSSSAARAGRTDWMTPAAQHSNLW